MERDRILENFQAISQNQNFEECIQILESVNWDLNKALENVEQQNDYSVPTMETGSLITPTHFYHRNLVFNVDVNGQNVEVTISEDKSVGDVAKAVARFINEPNCSLQINGLKTPYDDNTILKTLKLPLHNNVVATSADCVNTTNWMASSSQTNPQIYKLSIEILFDGKHHQTMTMTFSGNDSIGKVKTSVAAILGVDKAKQKWSGWPKNIVGTEVTLNESGLDYNSTLKVDVEKQITKSTPTDVTNTTTRPFDTFAVNSRLEDMDNDDDDFGYDYPDDMELMEDETAAACSKRPLSLMVQSAHLNSLSATLSFMQEFENRFCSPGDFDYDDSLTKDKEQQQKLKPPFFIGTLDDAICSTINLPPKQRKPLFIYLHHGQSIQANIFCSQILCYKEICQFFIESDYSIWPWDVTYPENKSEFMTWIKRSLGTNIGSRITIISKDQFPVLMAIGKSQGLVEMIELLDGSKSRDEILHYLWDIKTRFLDAQVPDIMAWEERELREQVKKEQDDAYNESLLRDQLKEQERDKEKRLLEEAETKANEKKQLEEQKRNESIQAASHSLPPEPPDDTVDIVMVRFRPPLTVNSLSANGTTRRFLYTHTVADLVAYMESLGFLRSEFKLLMTYPRKDITQIKDVRMTLMDLGIRKRETLIIEMI